MAMRMGGLIVFGEHRFFGKSVPLFPADTDEEGGADPRAAAFEGKANRIGLLSVEQGLADYAAMISHIRTDYDAW